MAPKGSSGGGKGGLGSTSGGGGGGGDDSGLSPGEVAAIVIGIIVGPLLIWFTWALIMDGLQKLRDRRQQKIDVANAQAQQGQHTGVELGQQLPVHEPPEQTPARPEPTYPGFDKMLYSGSLPMTHPTTPAYDTGERYRPS